MRKRYYDFCKNSKWFVLCIAVVYVVTIAMAFISGIGVDIKFTGGALLKYSYTGGTVDLKNIESIAEGTLGRDVTVQENTDSSGNKMITISVANRGGTKVNDEPAAAGEEDAAASSEETPIGDAPVVGDTNAGEKVENPEVYVANDGEVTTTGAEDGEVTTTGAEDGEVTTTDDEDGEAAEDAAASTKTEADIYAVNVEEEAALKEAIQKAYPDVTFTNAGSNSVSASMGKETLIKSLIAVLIAVGLMLIYIAIRFRKIGGWRAGFCAIVSLLVSLSFVFATFVIMGSSLSENFIAVMLTILGYAINNTIIIYDRVRENKAKLGRGRVDYAKLVNDSMNETLTRTINTTITTSIAIGTVAVMSIVFNIESIISFAFPMLVGIIVGTLSTLFISGPLWVKLQKN
ncbi:MAG: hypothetical protein IJL83_06990 [Clostridia bacterium]|nr:hypothetical protein [Clostridia bacterium]